MNRNPVRDPETISELLKSGWSCVYSGPAKIGTSIQFYKNSFPGPQRLQVATITNQEELKLFLQSLMASEERRLH